jgi:phosphoenolpyruvate carboxylase
MTKSRNIVGVPPLLLDPVFVFRKNEKLLFRFCAKYTQLIQYSSDRAAYLTCKTCNKKHIGISGIFRRYRQAMAHFDFAYDSDFISPDLIFTTLLIFAVEYFLK